MTTTASAPTTAHAYDSTRVYQDGIVAGILAALAVALWFLVFDTIRGQPFYTPNLLGTALFGRGAIELDGDGNLVAIYSFVVSGYYVQKISSLTQGT